MNLLRLAAKAAAVVSLAGVTAFGAASAASASPSGFPPYPPPYVTHCTSHLFFFNFPHGSHVLYETQGPSLRVNEVVIYRPIPWVITSVQKTLFFGHDRFTVQDWDGPVVNTGPSIWHGAGHLFTCTH